jgi:UDP-glucose 4-epimerase
MRVLITGGAGFVGANLSRELLANGHDVSIIDDLSTGRESNIGGLDVDFQLGSILDLDLLTSMAIKTEAIVHLAARSSVPRSLDDPIASHMANASGSLNVLEASRAAGGRHVVMASSSSVYGANPELPKRESAATRPMSPYAASKLAAEAYALAYRTSFDIPTLAFRFFNVFGPLQPAGHVYAAVIPAFVDAALKGNTITVHGDGTQSRDFTHVSTVCNTIRRALENEISSPDPVNLAFGSRIDLNQVLSLIAAQVDRPLVVGNIANRVGDVPHSQADCSLLRSLIPAIDPIDFEVGLSETIDWMRTVVDEPEINLATPSATYSSI